MSTKCALYREAYGHEDLEMLIDELHQGIRNPNVKKNMTEREYASIPEYTKHAMFTVTLVTKQLKWGIAVVDSTEGLTGSAIVQLPQYAAMASDAVPKFGTVPARINMMSGPYEAAQVTGFGLHHMEVESQPVSQVQEPDNLRHSA